MSIHDNDDALKKVRRKAGDSRGLYRILVDECPLWHRALHECRLSLIRGRDHFTVGLSELNNHFNAFDRLVIVTAANQLRRLRGCRKAQDAIAQRLEEVSVIAESISNTFNEKVVPQQMELILQRHAAVISWLLGLKLPGLEKLRIDRIALGENLITLATDVRNQRALTYLRKQSMFLKHFLPIPSNDVPLVIRPQSVQIPERYSSDRLYGKVTRDGFSYWSYTQGCWVADVPLPLRLWSIVGATWYCHWIQEVERGRMDCTQNKPLVLVVDCEMVKGALGKTLNRTNISQLRRSISYPLGDGLITIGSTRVFVASFCLDERDKGDEEPFEEFVMRFMAEKGWTVLNGKVARAQKAAQNQL